MCYIHNVNSEFKKEPSTPEIYFTSLINPIRLTFFIGIGTTRPRLPTHQM